MTLTDGLLRRVDPHVDAINRDGLDSGAEGWLRVPESPEWDATEFRSLGVAGKRHVYAVWNLSRETVICECRDQADDASRNPESNRNQIRIRERWLLGKPEEAAGYLFHFAALAECLKRSRMNSYADLITRSQHASVLGEQLARLCESGLADRH